MKTAEEIKKLESELPMWAKLLPLTGVIVGIYLANKKNPSAVGYIGYSTLGALAGSVIPAIMIYQSSKSLPVKNEVNKTSEKPKEEAKVENSAGVK